MAFSSLRSICDASLSQNPCVTREMGDGGPELILREVCLQASISYSQHSCYNIPLLVSSLTLSSCFLEEIPRASPPRYPQLRLHSWNLHRYLSAMQMHGLYFLYKLDHLPGSSEAPFKPSPQEAEAAGSLSLRPAWSTEPVPGAVQRNPVSKK